MFAPASHHGLFGSVAAVVSSDHRLVIVLRHTLKSTFTLFKRAVVPGPLTSMHVWLARGFGGVQGSIGGKLRTYVCLADGQHIRNRIESPAAEAICLKENSIITSLPLRAAMTLFRQ